MAVGATALIWEHSNSSGDLQVLMLALADSADETMTVLTDEAFLAKTCRVEEHAVQGLLEGLQDMGELHVIRQARQSNIYLILLTQSWAKIFTALTCGLVPLSREKALLEMAKIHARIVSLFDDPTQVRLCREQLAALEQLRELPDAYRLDGQET